MACLSVWLFYLLSLSIYNSIIFNILNRIWTIIDIIKWATQFFENKEVDSPRLTIELMLSKLFNIDRIGLYTNFEKPLSDDELDILHQWVVRRAKREPLQYILGTVNFYGFWLNVNRNVLIPRPETEILADIAIKIIQKNNYRKIIDIGTGSGCIAIAIAKKCTECEITAVDVSKEAILLAEENAQKNECTNINYTVLDIISDIPSERYDLVISNPPYIPNDEINELEPEVKDYEPIQALTDGKDGLQFFKRFSEIIPHILNKQGSFLFEIEAETENQISEMFSHYSNIEFISDFSDIKRILFGRNY